MAPPEKEKPKLMDNLLRQGVTEEEIKRIHRTLRDKGYGEEEARRRSRAASERLNEQRRLEERRRGEAPSRVEAAAGKGETGETPPRAEAAAAARLAAEKARGRRAVDWLPETPPWLRRRINRYAFSKGFLITRLPERFDDFMSHFDPSRGDYANRSLVQLLAADRGYRGRNPYQLSFIDALDALRDSARRLLGFGGEAAGDASRDAELFAWLRARDPFAVSFLGVFTEPHEMLRGSLAYLGASLRAGTRVKVGELARVVKDGCRLLAVTEAIEREKLEALFDLLREVHFAHRPGARTSSELTEAERLFRAAYQNLRRYRHELYPALLKMIGAFYEEEDASDAKRAAVLEFLELREEDILTWEGWQRRARELRERELAEQQARDLARLEHEEAERFGVRFEGTLATLASLFPDSGVERMEQGEYIIPYFVNRIFTRASAFQARQADLERLSGSDAMGLVIVFHSILDDLLSSLEPYALEKHVGTEGIAAAFIALRDTWRQAFPGLFEPYLDAIREFVLETEGDPRYARLFRESPRARGIEERINQLRNGAIRNFGHLASGRDHYAGPKLHELASRLSELLTEVGEVVNRETLSAGDPMRRRTAEDLSKEGIVDFMAASQTGSAEYRPVTRQIRRWIEARFREPVLDIPRKAQVAFMDVFRGVAGLYEYLLNDPNSFAARAGHGVLVATEEERAAWARERGARGRETLESLQAALREEFPGQFLDSLTGLRNKDYFLGELPRHLEKLRARRVPLSFLLIDIDHFKWVNDELGHSRGDEVLKATTGMILDNIRDGDLAVRYGGEEILVVVPASLHTAIVLAERLRFVHESRVIGSDAMEDVRNVGEAGGQACGTLSIGVADVTGIPELAKAVEKADRALYAAKRTRNAVVFVDPSREKGGGEPFSTYAEYRRRARDPKP